MYTWHERCINFDVDSFCTPQKLEAELVSLEADVPRSQALAEKLTSELSRQEAELESMLEAIKGEVEGYHVQLGEVGGCLR